MKAHHVVALLLIVALTAAGYALTVWQSSSLPHEEAAHEEAASPAPATGQPTAPATHSSVAGTPGATKPSQPTVTAPGSSATHTATPLGNVTVALTVTSQRQEDNQPPVVTITLQPVNQVLPLKGWHLSDAIGRGGIIDHIYYFGDLALEAGQTLTIHSSCARDNGLTRYWCMGQPLSLLDAATKALFLVDPNGAVALTCTPQDATQTVMAYTCH